MTDHAMATAASPELGRPGRYIEGRTHSSLRHRKFIIALGCSAFTYFVLKVSWVADDAYITLRVVDNLLHGYGLRWNVIERVQVYTHPLWMLLLVPFRALFGSSLLAMMVPGWLTALAGILVLLRRSRTSCGALVAFSVLVLSQSVVDFSTSGLENPLSHLLLILLLGGLPSEGGGVFRTALCCAFLLLSRLDLSPLVAPLVIREVIGSKGPRYLSKTILGLAPVALWLAFSTVYYGSPLPNTYVAKVGVDIVFDRTFLQGVRYFSDIALYEPLTLVMTLAGLAVGIADRSNDRAAGFLAIGMTLHLIYVFAIGGDFMNARFLTPQVVAAAWIGMRAVDRSIQRAELPFWARESGAVLGAVIVSAALMTADFHSFASRKAPSIRPSTITDERQFYFSATSLWLRWWEYLKDGAQFEVAHSWADLGQRLRVQQSHGEPYVHENMGFLGFYAGPTVHIVDRLGLTDAFIARLPVANFWTAGHGKRIVPDDYLESLIRRRNIIADPLLHRMFDDVAIATRSKGLFVSARWGAIWRLNTGYYRGVTTERGQDGPGRSASGRIVRTLD